MDYAIVSRTLGAAKDYKDYVMYELIGGYDDFETCEQKPWRRLIKKDFLIFFVAGGGAGISFRG